MKPYRPALTSLPDGGFEQTFTANVVDVDDGLIAFGELVPNDPRGLPYGTVVHSLLIHLEDEEPSMIELNDQGNTVDADRVAHAELERGRLRLVFYQGDGPFAGRVSLDKSIDIFEDVAPDHAVDVAFKDYVSFDDVQLRAISVKLDIDDALFATVRKKLEDWRRRHRTARESR
jgi:hypothetical protein